MWRKSENSNSIKPLAIDMKSSSTHVYVRRNFEFIKATDERESHYEYEEMILTKEEWSKVSYLYDSVIALEQQNEFISEVLDALLMGDVEV